jgi:hypothetical protein
MMTILQKIEAAKEYLKSKQISFGSREADDTAVEIFIAGLNHKEALHEEVKKEFKQAYVLMFKDYANWCIDKMIQIKNQNNDTQVRAGSIDCTK